MRPIVFLHIPKTAGQTIHHALGAMVGARNISPVRVNEQAPAGDPLPPGYLLHSGHLDWINLERVAGDPFVFSVLRDPAERIGSFYFFMQRTAQQASPQELKARHGLARIRQVSADEYFFGGDTKWQEFIQNMYFNFYCSYFATRKVNGRKLLRGLDSDDIVARALRGTEALDRIYLVDNLVALENDIERIYGHRIVVAGHYVNAGSSLPDKARWPQLCARFETDASIRRLEAFLTEDIRLMDALGKAGRLA